MVLLKYLEVEHHGSRNGLGCLVLALKLGFLGNIELCLSDWVHFIAKRREIFSLLVSRRSSFRTVRAFS